MRKVDGGILKQKVNSQMPFKQNGEKNVQTPTGTRAHRSRHSRNRFSLPFCSK
uniref:Uncharacterized protein n=1 Tax=Anguilla anguilla TaxID=7936 RepID=A0A0E9PI71_ANGAN